DLLETFAEQLGGGIELARAYAAAEALDSQREEILALISHDLRQPLVAIATVAEALGANPSLTPRELRALDGLRQQARSLLVFAEDVLSISQVESGQFRLRPVPFDLRVLLTGLAQQLSERARI